MAFVLTQMSCACALGRTADEVWTNWCHRVAPGMTELPSDVPGRSVRFGLVPGELPSVADPGFDFRANRLLRHAVQHGEGCFEALVARYGSARVAVVLGVSNTGMDEAQRGVDTWLETGEKPSGLHFSQIELGTPAVCLAHLLGITGPAYAVSTACSSGAKAFSAARRLIETGVVEAAVVGGVDGRCRFAMNGFAALGALASGVCRPLAPDRDGINLGEGVALFTLERTVASASGVELAGVGETSDAYHATAPDPEGRGAEAAMRAALAEAGCGPEDVGYVNLHGTGTLANDTMEMKAVRRLLDIPETIAPAEGAFDIPGAQGPLRVESTKAFTGHCLGAAGAVEAALVWLKVARGAMRGVALSNSFAFGGSNACVAMRAGAWR